MQIISSHPILHNLKYPLVQSDKSLFAKDEFIFSLSTKETVNFIKRSFLNDNFSRFFKLYGQIKINEVPKNEKNKHFIYSKPLSV